ncbi:glutathione S-transferase N-terminal domain-containing protein [Patescibacteria group bacterium]|nr:glutathione S-transferase N-terminal domain-containing protein [Patescibacteria group bacterium]
MKIIVYTTLTCPYCNHVKDFLKEHNIQFKEVDLTQNQEMIDELIKKTGQMAVPMTEIDGEIIVGFDVPKLKQKLNIK